MRWIFWVLILCSSTGFGQSSLEGAEYSDGVIFISSETYGWSWTYKFGKNEYQLYLFFHYDSPKTYLFEEGNYTLKNEELVFKPKKKLLCELTEAVRYACLKGQDTVDGFLVSIDSLSKNEIIDLSFTDRVCKISTEADKLTFKDLSMPFAEFRQR
jgi:hypothetical protein